MTYQFSHTYNRSNPTEAEIQQAGAELAESKHCARCGGLCPSGTLETGLCSECNLIGQTVEVQWGQWRTTAKVTHISKNGAIYGKRWQKAARCWTSERRLYRWKGIFST